VTVQDSQIGVHTASLPAATAAAAGRAWARIESWLVVAGDWLNPILVKETRQALKSRQFVMTFLLVLIACWVVTIGGVALIGPGIFYAAAGGTMLISYFIVLAFPLAIVVPYSAFRSLASEREDNTFDLLSITTLKPRQIISGKLGSAIAQMAVYYSAVTPCIAFTYLLRGVDVPTIAILLVYAFFSSLGLSMIGLLLATMSRQRYGHVFMSVLFVAGLMGTFWGGCLLAWELIESSYSYAGDVWFWIGSLAALTAWASTFAMAFYAAAGMLTFSSENRATPLRIVMLAQQACWIGWLGFAWIVENLDVELTLVMVTMAGLYWYAAGILLTAERPGLSERVKRRLPKSSLGRLFLTWLNPGPYSGYLFVVANTTAVAAILIIEVLITELSGRGRGGWPSAQQVIYLTFIGWGYLVAYLGLGLLVITAVRRVAVVQMAAAVLIQLLLILAGSGIPSTIQLMSVELRELDYTYLQITNPFWTLHYLGERGLPTDGLILLVIVSCAAICTLLFTLPAVVRELRQTRIAPPPRVIADELELHPLPPPQPTNPWGDVK
jgi:hypothetical protein